MIGYTDGSCFPNPGPGAWAYVIVENDSLISKRVGRDPDTTNNRMEYYALIRMLEDFGSKLSLALTDSELLQKTAMVWRHKWKQNGWRRKIGPSEKHEIKNIDLVMRLDSLLSRYPVPVQWIRGHSGNRWNEEVDSLARGQIEIRAGLNRPCQSF